MIEENFFSPPSFFGVDHVCGVRIVLHRESEQVRKCLCLFELVDSYNTAIYGDQFKSNVEIYLFDKMFDCKSKFGWNF